MTKYFIQLADCLRAEKPVAGRDLNSETQWQKDVEAVASVCKASNPRFNYERWIGYINGDNGPCGGRI